MYHLYRHFDKEGTLLYVGISLNGLQRLVSHKEGARWFSEISRVEIEKHASKKAASIAEGLAIRTEKPKYNVHFKDHGHNKYCMTRDEAIALFGSVRKVCLALNITHQAVYKWPRNLTQRLEDRVMGAKQRTKKAKANGASQVRQDRH